MKKIITMVLCLVICNSALAEGTWETVCHNKLDNNGNVVKDKKGNTVQNCKKVKVHKKLETTTSVPAK